MRWTLPGPLAPLLISVCGLIFVAPAQGQAPIGELEVRGSVSVGQPDGVGMVRINNTSYTWFSGDRIEVRSGSAILTLDGGQSFGFLEGTQGSLRVEDERIIIDLDDGMLLYAIEGEEAELVVNKERFINIAAPSGQLEPCLGLNAVGLVHARNSDEVDIIVQSGILDGGTADGQLTRRVEPGEQVTFTQSEIIVSEIVLPEEVEEQLEEMEEGQSLPCIIWWLRQEEALGFISRLTAGQALAIGALIGGGAGYIFFDDETVCPVCPRPVSP